MMGQTEKTQGDGTSSLLVFQLGPVQDFIAQARSTRDLWSGSYMLSWLMAHAIKETVVKGAVRNADVVLPSLEREENPLVLALRNLVAPIDEAKSLVSNMPNRCLMLVPAEKEKFLADTARQAIGDELSKMGDAVWSWLKDRGAKDEWHNRWINQIAAFPQFTYAWTRWAQGEPWKDAYERVGKQLAARRNTRDFSQWEGENAPKDSLSGKEECIGDEAFWKNLREKEPLFKTEGHVYGAINLIKRLWVHVDEKNDANYLATALNFFESEVWKELKTRSVPEIAESNIVPGDTGGGTGTPSKNGYIALLAMDGDHMGELLSKQNQSPEALQDFSASLSAFALDSVKGIVKAAKGELIYAGGDDVLAILPSTRAIACAKKLRDAFRKCITGGDLSCGIAVGHKNAPLQMLVKEAQKAEHKAKEEYGRSAIAIALYKRSGEIIEWGAKWDSNALDVMQEVTDLTSLGYLSGRFPYALAELLQPYDLAKGSLPDMASVIKEEVRHVVSRQGRNLPKDSTFLQDVETYLNDLGAKKRLEDFINLFLAETFINRAREEE